jgi:hypothetical protein
MANGNVFKPSGAYSTPTIESELTLQTEQAKRFFSRCFEGAGRALFTTDVIARALAQSNKSFDHGEVMSAINTMLSKVEKDISDAIERFKVLLKTNGHAESRARYQAAETMTFSISTPEILRFAKLIAQFDEMIQLFDTAWLVGLIDSKKAQSFRGDQLRMLMRIVRKLQSQATMARRKARTEGSEEAIEALKEVLDENDAERQATAEAEKAETGEAEAA